MQVTCFALFAFRDKTDFSVDFAWSTIKISRNRLSEEQVPAGTPTPPEAKFPDVQMPLALRAGGMRRL